MHPHACTGSRCPPTWLAERAATERTCRLFLAPAHDHKIVRYANFGGVRKRRRTPTAWPPCRGSREHHKEVINKALGLKNRLLKLRCTTKKRSCCGLCSSSGRARRHSCKQPCRAYDLVRKFRIERNKIKEQLLSCKKVMRTNIKIQECILSQYCPPCKNPLLALLCGALQARSEI